MSDFTSIKQWLKSTEDEPLETMSGFFDRRVDSYEDHMRPWRAYYRWLGELIPAQAETLLDLGCGTGLELDEIFRLPPGHPGNRNRPGARACWLGCGRSTRSGS